MIISLISLYPEPYLPESQYSFVRSILNNETETYNANN